jgi:hypothetical protein
MFFCPTRGPKIRQCRKNPTKWKHWFVVCVLDFQTGLPTANVKKSENQGQKECKLLKACAIQKPLSLSDHSYAIYTQLPVILQSINILSLNYSNVFKIRLGNQSLNNKLDNDYHYFLA